MDIHLQSFTTPHFPSLMIAMLKHAYLTVLEYSSSFVSSRRQYRLTVGDLLTHCLADDKADRFLNIELDDLQPHLDHIGDKGPIEMLKHGFGTTARLSIGGTNASFHAFFSQERSKRLLRQRTQLGACRWQVT